MQRTLLVILVMLLVVLIPTQVSAQESDFDVVIINSKDGMDVFSGIMYANLNDIPFLFIVSHDHGKLAAMTLDSRTVDNILLIESESNPFFYGYAAELRSNGFVVEEITSPSGRELNIDIAKELPTKNFVVVDASVGYNAVSSCYFSRVSDSYLLILDSTNVDAAVEMLREKKPKNILIFGYVENVVKAKLAEFNPETLDMLSKYENNIAINERALQIESSDQATLTDGSFMEVGMMLCEHPIVFIGPQITPTQISDFLYESPIRIGVLVGDYLVSARALDRSIDNRGKDFTLIVKYGQGMPQLFGNQILPLDMFPLPGYPLGMDIVDAVYNEAPEKLEVTYKNLVAAAAWFQPTIEILSDGVNVLTVGDKEPLLIEKNGVMTRQYDVERDLLVGNVSAKVTIIYGEFPSAMDHSLTKIFPLLFIERNDSSEVWAERLAYYFGDEKLILTVKNPGSTPVYFKEDFTLKIGDSEQVFKKDTTIHLGVGQSINVEYPSVKLDWSDINANSEVMVHFVHGETADYMVSRSQNPVSLEPLQGSASSSGGLGGDSLTSLLGNPIVILLISTMVLIPLIFLFILPRRRPLKILDVVYSKSRSQFEVVVKNGGKVVHASALVKYFGKAGKAKVFSKRQAMKKMGPHELRTFTIPAKLSKSAFDSTKKVEANILYRLGDEKKDRLAKKSAGLKIVGGRR